MRYVFVALVVGYCLSCGLALGFAISISYYGVETFTFSVGIRLSKDIYPDFVILTWTVVAVLWVPIILYVFFVLLDELRRGSKKLQDGRSRLT